MVGYGSFASSGLASCRGVAWRVVSYRFVRGGIVIRLVGGGAMVCRAVKGGTEAQRRMGRWSAGIPVQGARRLYGDGDAGRAGDGQGMQQ